ncbi:MAG: OmpA family protein [Rikenellaceae bacterium]
MKIRNFLVAALLLVTASSQAQAQTSDSTPVYVQNSFWSNWFVDAGVGALLYAGDADSSGDFAGRIAPAVNINLGKWITPNLAVRVGYLGVQSKGYTFGGVEQDWTLTNIRMDAMLNVINFFCGYNADRLYSPIPYAGVGLVRNGSNGVDEIGGTLGLQNSFKLSDAFNLNLDVNGTIVKDRLDGELGGKRLEGFLAVTVGATYKFNPRGWKVQEASDLIDKSVLDGMVSKSELEKAQEQARNAQKENKGLKDELASTKNQLTSVKSAPKSETVISSCIVFFEVGSSKLSKEDLVTLKLAAEAINADKSGKTFSVVGYADNATGGSAVNEKVSKARAEAVCNALVNDFGVDKSKLNVSYKGGVDNMYYNDPKLSRAVIVE